MLPQLALLREFVRLIWKRRITVARGGLGMTPVVPGLSWLRSYLVRTYVLKIVGEFGYWVNWVRPLVL